MQADGRVDKRGEGGGEEEKSQEMGGEKNLRLEAMKGRRWARVQRSSLAEAVTNNMRSQNVIMSMTASCENALQLVFI